MLSEATFWVTWAAVLCRIGYAPTHRVFMLELLAEPSMVLMMAVKARILSMLAGDAISALG